MKIEDDNNAKADIASNASTNASKNSLPLLDNGVVSSHQQKRLFKLKRKFLLLPLVILIFALGGFVGLYFQPPGLQFFMKTTGLSPGGGTSHPIAVSQKAMTKPIAEVTLKTVKALGTLLPLRDLSLLAPPYGAIDRRGRPFEGICNLQVHGL